MRFRGRQPDQQSQPAVYFHQLSDADHRGKLHCVPLRFLEACKDTCYQEYSIDWLVYDTVAEYLTNVFSLSFFSNIYNNMKLVNGCGLCCVIYLSLILTAGCYVKEHLSCGYSL